MAGDMGESTNQSLFTLTFDQTPRGFTFGLDLDETQAPPPGTVRPSSPDDGHWFWIDDTNPDPAMRNHFMWVRGGDGEPMFYNSFLRGVFKSQDSNGTIGHVKAAIAAGWDISSKMYLYEPLSKTFKTYGPTYQFNGNGHPDTANATLGGHSVADLNGWTQDGGNSVFPSVWTASSSMSRNAAYDRKTNTLWRFYDFGSPALASFNFTTKVVRIFNLSTWVSDETGLTYYTKEGTPSSPADVIADGTKPAFGFYNAGSGRHSTPFQFNWEHKATWIDDADGKLYVVAADTGYLWCFETRGENVGTHDGWKLPYYPVGQRVPLVGCYPEMDGLNAYPPVRSPQDVRMNSFLVPFKGGLLWWSSSHHDHGVMGHPLYAFWRALGDKGAWTVVTMPKELNANSFSLKSRLADNDEVVMISTAGNSIGLGGMWPFFWKLT